MYYVEYERITEVFESLEDAHDFVMDLHQKTNVIPRRIYDNDSREWECKWRLFLEEVE